MKPSILRVKDGARCYWVVADGTATVAGHHGQSMTQVVRRYEDANGKPPEGYIRIPGQLKPAEAALHRAELTRRVPRSCRACGCTDDDCRQCVEATGTACSWVEGEDPPICSRCYRCPHGERRRCAQCAANAAWNAAAARGPAMPPAVAEGGAT